MDELPRDMSPQGIAMWGFETGRYSSDDVERWQRRLENERNRVIASGRTGRYVSAVADQIRAMPTSTQIVRGWIDRANKLLASAGYRDDEEAFDDLFRGSPAEERRKWDAYHRQVEQEERQRIMASADSDDELDAAIALLTPEGARKARDAALDAYLDDDEFNALFGR